MLVGMSLQEQTRLATGGDNTIRRMLNGHEVETYVWYYCGASEVGGPLDAPEFIAAGSTVGMSGYTWSSAVFRNEYFIA